MFPFSAVMAGSSQRVMAPLKILASVGASKLRTSVENRDGYVDRDGDVGGRRHVVDAQQIKTCEQASAHRAGEVAAIEIAEPGNTPWRRFDVAGDRRKGRAQ
jgi:hypothetical protein